MEPSGGNRTLRRFCSILATVGLVGGTLAVTASSASAATCKAKDGPTSYSDLASAVNAANSGDTIVVSGTCLGTFIQINKDLTLMAKTTATVDGFEDPLPDFFITGSATTVTFKNLVITHGGAQGFGIGGGGIFDDAGLGSTVNLIGHTKVIDNTSMNQGGGIYVAGGTLNIGGHVQVSGNVAEANGGGIASDSRSVVNIGGNAQVFGNMAGTTGGGIDNTGFSSTVDISGKARVYANTAAASGGGIENTNRGTVNLSGGAHVSGNTAATDGGGIFNDTNSTLTLSGSAHVNANTATTDGGGVYNVGTLTLIGTVTGVQVKSNIPDDIAP